MTQQMKKQPIAIEPSLERKLSEFVDSLTGEDEVQFHSMRVETGADQFSPLLRAKLQQAADRLTPEEKAQVHDLLQRAAIGAAADGADAQGYRAAEYEDEYGYKGRPGSNIQPIAGGGAIVGIVGSEIWNRSGIPQFLKALGTLF